MALSAILAPPCRWMRARFGEQLAAIVYLDDRSGLTASPEALKAVLAEWQAFAEASALPDHPGKLQIWARS
eukprot:15444122-Alexandrium_andersonii.AAC.1